MKLGIVVPHDCQERTVQLSILILAKDFFAAVSVLVSFAVSIIIESYIVGALRSVSAVKPSGDRVYLFNINSISRTGKRNVVDAQMPHVSRTLAPQRSIPRFVFFKSGRKESYLSGIICGYNRLCCSICIIAQFPNFFTTFAGPCPPLKTLHCAGGKKTKKTHENNRE